MTDRLVVVTREAPGILSPDALLARGEGACRDLTVCFMAAASDPEEASPVFGTYRGDPGLSRLRHAIRLEMF
ncbi:hypothetical protein [Solidesulfovibrio sp. C21]|uniref:hypothetical protein n=1 Tax=Solidesulfovibrio sp. C21 TaxID=3398613 RepID=UPI0039FD6F98